MTSNSNGIPATKMSGCGNDFLLIDNRDNRMADIALSDFIINVCRRQMSAGADGLILIENDDDLDFRWQFFNSDGGRAEMCGNGARCAARFAHLNGIAGTTMAFGTDAGVIEAEMIGDQVKVKMTPPSPVVLDEEIQVGDESVRLSSVNTGVPHAVMVVEDIDQVDVAGLGRMIRMHSHFAPAGTNANFIQVLDDGLVAMRTYERGVEDETLACGTGAVAVGLVTALSHALPSPVRVRTRSGGILTIHFGSPDSGFEPVYMEGDARIIYTCELHPDSWTY